MIAQQRDETVGEKMQDMHRIFKLNDNRTRVAAKRGMRARRDDPHHFIETAPQMMKR